MYIWHATFKHFVDRPRGYKTWVQYQTQNKAQWLAACGHVSASSQSLRFILSLRMKSSFITLRPGTLVNSYDLDEMSHKAAFLQGIHCFLRQNRFWRKKYISFGIITGDTLYNYVIWVNQGFLKLLLLDHAILDQNIFYINQLYLIILNWYIFD